MAMFMTSVSYSPSLLLPSLSIIPDSTNSLSKFSSLLSFQCHSTNYVKKSVLHITSSPAAVNNERCVIEEEEEEEAVVDEDMRITKEMKKTETHLYSFAPLPLFFVAALPGASAVRSLFGPIAEIIKTLNLPDWLVHWGHPGNMAVVLFAMGGYGTYLGFRIKYSNDVEEKAKAKDLHPKLLAGMFFFFALGATGGIISLLTTDKPIFESPHALTGLIGLALLTIQTLLPTKFEENPGLRNVHGILGSGIMTLFFVHAALGLQLGLSF